MSRGVVLALLCAVGWGASYVFVRRGQRRARVDTGAGLFLTVVTNNLVNLVVVGEQSLAGSPLQVPWLAVFWFVLAGASTTFFGRVVAYRAVALIGPSRTDALKVAQPIFTAILAVVLLHEAVGPFLLLGMALILGGAWLLTTEHARAEGAHAVAAGPEAGQPAALRTAAPPLDPKLWRLGIVFGALGALLYGVGNVLRKAGIDVYPSAVAGVTVSTLAALVFVTAGQLAQGRGPVLWQALRRPDRDYFLAGLTNSLGQYAFFSSTIYLPVSITTVVASVEPFFTALASRLLLGRVEPLGRRFFAAAGLIVAGVTAVVLHVHG